jgi:hypothetical protein
MLRLILLALCVYQALAIKCYTELVVNGERVSGDYTEDPAADICISGNFKCGVNDAFDSFCGDIKESARVKKTGPANSAQCQQAQSVKSDLLEKWEVTFSCCNTDACNALNVTETTLSKGTGVPLVDANGNPIGNVGNGTTIGNGTIGANGTTATGTATVSPTAAPTAGAGSQRSAANLLKMSPVALFLGLSFLALL